MPQAPRAGHAPVVFTDDAFDDDIAHASSGGRAAGEAARRRYERGGVPVSELRHVEAEGRDGTTLPRCLKVYLPPPDGRFGMVFQLRVAEDGRPYLACLAFGTRHPSGPGALSVYAVASRRLNG
jgi:hypothetical protein